MSVKPSKTSSIYPRQFDNPDRNSGLTPAARHDRPDRYWFLTWTTYGTWLPGDDRGFVSNIDRGDGKGHRLNMPGTEPARKMRGLEIMAREKMAGPPVYLNLEQATGLLDQFHETANYRAFCKIAHYVGHLAPNPQYVVVRVRLCRNFANSSTMNGN